MIKILLITVYMSGMPGEALRVDHIKMQSATEETCTLLERNERVAINDGREGFIVASCMRQQEL